MSADLPPPDLAALSADLRVTLSRLRRRLRQQGPTGELTEAQRTVLRLLLQAGPQTVTELARREGIRSQSMGVTVASLEAAGLLSRRPDPRDGRQSLLELSAQGRALVEASRKAREDWLHAAIETRLSPQEQRTLADALPVLQRLL